MKNYYQIHSREYWVSKDQELIVENRGIVRQIKELKQRRQSNLAERRAIGKQIRAHDYELFLLKENAGKNAGKQSLNHCQLLPKLANGGS